MAATSAAEVGPGAPRRRKAAGAIAPGRRAGREWLLLLLLLLAIVIGFGPLPERLLGVSAAPDPTGSTNRAGPVDTIDLFLYDAALVSSRPAGDPSIAIIDIDDDSLGQIGRWPWSRTIIATLLQRLGEYRPEAVAIDVLLTESSADPDADRLLADSLAQLAIRSRVILAAGRAPTEDGHFLPLYPLPLFAEQAMLAHGLFVTGSDGLVRGLNLEEANMPALSQALVDPRVRPAIGNPGDWLSDGVWPAGDGRLIGLSQHEIDRIPAAALLRGEVRPERLAGRRLLLGTTAVGAGDQFATPLLAGRIQASGVELHAAAGTALAAGRVIRTLPAWLHALLTAAILVALMASHWRTRPLTGLAVTVATLGTLIAVTFGLFRLGLWLQPGALLVSAALSYPLWSWRRLTAASAGLFAQARQLELTGDIFPVTTQGDSPREPISAQLIRVQHAADQVGRMNRFLRDAIHRLPHPVLVADDRYRVVLCNEKLALAFQPVPRPGESMMDWLGHVLEQPALRKLNAPRELQGEFRDAHGRHWMVDVGQTGDGSDDSRWMLQLVDITPLRLAEREREEALSFLSHDLRSPQAAILAMIDRARGGRGDTFDLDLNEVERQARRALSLTDGFLQFARADAKPMLWSEIDLEILAVEVADLAWFTASTRSVRVLASGPAEAVLRGDQELLRRALTNLVENAIRHSPPGSTVRIQHEPDPGGWLIVVEDEGPGVPASMRSKIFDAFWQPSPGGASHLGSAGLGLALVSRCVTRHGGTIQVVDRAEGPGARFEIRLPRHAEAIIQAVSIA